MWNNLRFPNLAVIFLAPFRSLSYLWHRKFELVAFHYKYLSPLYRVPEVLGMIS